MRIYSLAAVAAAALSLGFTLVGHVSAARQAPRSTSLRDAVFGYQDLQTGAFHAIPQVAPDYTQPGWPPAVNGTITTTFTVALKTAIPDGDVVECEVTLKPEYYNTNGNVSYTDSAFAQGTVNGSTATCVVKVPFFWSFPSPGGDDQESLTGSYSVAIANPNNGIIAAQSPRAGAMPTPEATTLLFPLVHSTSGVFLMAEKTGGNLFTSLPLDYNVTVKL